jgi:predicted glycoside hydrolase/deacetylase ChbG (UPF0249 family)
MERAAFRVGHTTSMLIITADDYGKTTRATDSILEAFTRKRITSAAAMVFMEDSERSAPLALKAGLEVGLHLNFTLPFTGSNVSAELRRHHDRVVTYLGKHKFRQLIYNPMLNRSFDVLFRAQEAEFVRLYGRSPDYYNGHHHMHLCANMLASQMIHRGARVRQTFTVSAGERNPINVIYRQALGAWLSKRYLTTQGFFSIEPVGDCDRLRQIVNRAHNQTIEIEVHPENANEIDFLRSDEYQSLLDGVHRGGFLNLH